jgi:hypothetical protein
MPSPPPYCASGSRSGSGPVPETENVTISRDEDCPDCGWPETYTEVNFTFDLLVAIGCRKCGWREERAGA